MQNVICMSIYRLRTASRTVASAQYAPNKNTHTRWSFCCCECCRRRCSSHTKVEKWICEHVYVFDPITRNSNADNTHTHTANIEIKSDRRNYAEKPIECAEDSIQQTKIGYLMFGPIPIQCIIGFVWWMVRGDIVSMVICAFAFFFDVQKRIHQRLQKCNRAFELRLLDIDSRALTFFLFRLNRNKERERKMKWFPFFRSLCDCKQQCRTQSG